MAFGTLEITLPNGKRQVVELTKPQMVIGRSADTDIPLDDTQVSRRHAIFISSAEGVRLVDTASANGTFIGETRLSPNQPVPLADGVVLRIGQTTISYHIPLETTPVEDTPKAPEEPKPVESTISKKSAAKEPDTKPRTGDFAPPPGGEGPTSLVELVPPDLTPIHNGERSSYLKYLPAIYSTDDFIGRLLLVFETILNPVERTIDNYAWYLDPRMTPAEFLPWMASWLGLVLDERWPESQRRELIQSAVDLYQWRGTRRGLSEFIRLYTGITPEIIEPGVGKKKINPKDAFRFTVRVKVKNPDEVNKAMLQSIIEMEKPAHAAYSLEVIT